MHAIYAPQNAAEIYEPKQGGKNHYKVDRQRHYGMSVEYATFFKRSLSQRANLKETGDVEMKWIIIVILRNVVKCPMVVDVCCMHEWRRNCMLECHICMWSVCACLCTSDEEGIVIKINILTLSFRN